MLPGIFRKSRPGVDSPLDICYSTKTTEARGLLPPLAAT